MSSAWPEPTAAELSTLTFHITHWGSRTRLQQSLCLALLRGHRDLPAIAAYLQVGTADLHAAVDELIGEGLHWDGKSLIFH